MVSATLAASALVSLTAAMPAPHGGRFPEAELSNGLRFPLVGLGCSSGVRTKHVFSALKLGYRHLDTAQAYQWGYHEDEVGVAVKESGVPRKELFIQSKIFPEDLGFASTKRAVEGSLQRLQLTYLDSMLIHKPRCWEGACSKRPEGTWQDSWRALQEFYRAGKVHAIGICDVDGALIDLLLEQEIKPHIIQNWMDPFHQDKEMRERCLAEGVQYQGYSTLGLQWVHFRGFSENPVLSNPKLNAIARAHSATVPQVVLNWATRHGVAVIPASTQESRQRANLDSFFFDLSQSEVEAIDSLDGNLESVAQQKPTRLQIQFRNAGPKDLQVFWVDPSGTEVHSGDIPPGGNMNVQTYDGHTFAFRGLDGSLVHSHLVQSSEDGDEVHIASSHNDL